MAIITARTRTGSIVLWEHHMILFVCDQGGSWEWQPYLVLGVRNFDGDRSHSGAVSETKSPLKFSELHSGTKSGKILETGLTGFCFCQKKMLEFGITFNYEMNVLITGLGKEKHPFCEHRTSDLRTNEAHTLILFAIHSESAKDFHSYSPSNPLFFSGRQLLYFEVLCVLTFCPTLPPLSNSWYNGVVARRWSRRIQLWHVNKSSSLPATNHS